MQISDVITQLRTTDLAAKRTALALSDGDAAPPALLVPDIECEPEFHAQRDHRLVRRRHDQEECPRLLGMKAH